MSSYAFMKENLQELYTGAKSITTEEAKVIFERKDKTYFAPYGKFDWTFDQWWYHEPTDTLISSWYGNGVAYRVFP